MTNLFFWIGVIFVAVSYLSIITGVAAEIRQFGWANLDWPTIIIAVIFAPLTIFYLALNHIIDMGLTDDWM